MAGLKPVTDATQALLDERYRLGEAIAEDHHSTLYSAWDERLARDVTIRVLAGATDAERFDREIRILGAVAEPAMVRVYDVCLTSEIPYVVLEPLHGKTLCEFRRLQKKLTDREVDNFVDGLGKALLAAHRLGFVHGAVRPHTILVCENKHERWVKLLGFGRAFQSGAQVSEGFRAESLRAVGFVAPEIVRQEPVDARTDVYGLGALMFFLLSGKPPVPGNNPGERLEAILRGERRNVQEELDVDPELADVISKALVPQQSMRIGSVQDLLEAWRAARTPKNTRSATSIPVGTVFEGGFQVRARLGRGGHGEVLLARDNNLQRPVAIKVLHQQKSSDREIERFHSEARAMASVDHPNVARIYSVGNHKGSPFLVMEYIAGEPLDTVLHEKGPLAAADALSVVRQVSDGLEAVHAAGLTHADIKPGNVLVGPGFRIVVTDFGLVRPTDSWTGNSALAGTPQYMAPERILEEVEPETAHLVDVYSLGVMAYELFAGVRPYRSQDPLKALLNHIKGPTPPPPSTHQPTLPSGVDEAIMRAIRRNPKERTQSCREFSRELEAAMQGLATGQSIHFLVVDDDEAMCDLAALYLGEAFPGCTTEHAHNGTDALEALERNKNSDKPFSAVLLDLFLPDMDAKAVARKLRSDFVDVPPVVVMTGTGSAADWQVLSALGVAAFLVKPLDRDLLGLTMTRLVATDSP